MCARLGKQMSFESMAAAQPGPVAASGRRAIAICCPTKRKEAA